MEDDEAQKMVALKKAYADIILNTAKEAAVRIMASERKAIRFQNDLCASRDEALRMLLRLKQMLDSKTTEADLKSLSQQRRIDELESQLQEAEEVITDLRAKLNRKGDDLENANRNQVQTVDLKFLQEASFSEKLSHIPDSKCETMVISDAKNIPINLIAMGDKCCCTSKQPERRSDSVKDGFDHGNLASIIMRSKKPELFRNGCTQRIRAFERNVLNGKVPHDDDNFPMENESISGADEKEANDGAVIEMDKNSSQGERKKPAKVLSTRRKKSRFGKAKTMRRCHQGQVLKSGQPGSASSNRKPSSCKHNDNSDEGERTLSAYQASDGSQESLQLDNIDEFRIFKKGKRKRITKSGNDDGSSTSPSDQLLKPSQPSPVLSRCRTFAYFVNGGIKSVENQSKSNENEANAKLSPGLDLISTLITKDSDSTLVSTDVKVADKSEPAQDDTQKNDESVKKGISVFLDDSMLSSLDLNAERTNALPLNCGSENVKASERVNESLQNVAENNRVLKYTFQRKRKREAASSADELASPEKISLTNNASESSRNSGLIDESSRDSRRLAQVARQLISLSGKRWR